MKKVFTVRADSPRLGNVVREFSTLTAAESYAAKRSDHPWSGVCVVYIGTIATGYAVKTYIGGKLHCNHPIW